MPTRRRKISQLGTLSLLIGVCALVATHVPMMGVGPVTIGVVGAAIGLLGLLSAVVIGHAGRVLPVLAIAICLGAAGYGLYANGHDDGIGARVTVWINQWHASGSQPPASNGHNSIGTGSPSSSSSNSGNESGGSQSVGHGTIFDVNTPGTPESPGHIGSTPAPSGVGNTPSVSTIAKPSGPDPALLASIRTRRADAQAAMQSAKAKLNAAQKALIASLSNQPAYQAAKAEVDAAEANLSSVRASGDSVLAASTRVLSAKIAVEKLFATASATDPATSAAQREFTDAQHALISIKAEQDAAAGKKP